MQPSPTHQTWLSRAILGVAPADMPIDEPEWRKLRAAAEWNGVTALVHQNIATLEITGDCPDWFSASLKSEAHLLAARELMLRHEVRAAAQRLANAGIEFILLKGTPLAYTLYPEPYLRERCDTDILFPTRQQADLAWNLLQSLSYRRRNTISGEYVASQYTCYKSGTAGVVHAFDVHWKLSNTLSIANVFGFEELKASARPVPALGDHVLAPGDPHAFLLACMHRVTNLRLGIADRLIWLYDISLLAQRMSESDWAATARCTVKKDLAGIVLSGLRKAREYFLVPIPGAFEAQLEALGRGGFSLEDTSQAWQYQLTDIKALPGWKAKLQFVKENLFPTADYMRRKYGTQSKLALPYYYCLRITQGAPKLFRRH